MVERARRLSQAQRCLTPRGALVRRAAALALVSTSALTGAVEARAGTVTVSGQTLSFDAAVGEANHVNIEMTSDRTTWVVSDSGASVTAGSGCVSVDADTASCPAPAQGTARVVVQLGDMDDWASGTDSCRSRLLNGPLFLCSLEIDGGDGDDTLIGNDDFDSATALKGGEGDDSLEGRNGTTVVDGGPGADTLVAVSDPNPATVVYSDRVNPVFVSLNARRDDGEAGENDLVIGFENIYGGSGNDVFVGNALAQSFWPGGGDDVVYARGGRDTAHGDGAGCEFWQYAEGGNDRLYGGAGTDFLGGCGGNDVLRGGAGNDQMSDAGGVDRLYGGIGDDYLLGGFGADALFGERGSDFIRGREGNDTMGGGPGRDTLRGSKGNDTFYARDGYVDKVVGALGRDRARLDRGLDRRWSIESVF